MKSAKQQFISVIFIFILTFSVSAQTAKQAKQKPDLSLQRLRASVTYLSSEKLDGRRTGTPGALAAAGYIASEFGKMGLQPGVSHVSANVDASKPRKLSRAFLQKFPVILVDDHGKTNPQPVDGYNVVGILPGTDAALKTEAIVIGAHFDHLGRGGMSSMQANSTEIHHGADDNASGVAALLELAKTFATEKKNRRTIVFIAFGGEEEGLIGSKFYINNPSVPLDKTVAMFNLDMVGRLKENKLTVGGVGTAGEWKNLVEAKNVAAGSAAQPQIVKAASKPAASAVGTATEPSANFPLFSLTLNEDGFGPSDHASFYSRQVPVLFFFTGIHEDYHKPSDTSEKINYDGLKQIVSFVASLVKAVDANQKRPTYAVAKSANADMGRRSFNVSLGTIPSYNETSGDGLTLDGVRDDSPASKAGLKGGDKIIRLGGKEIRNINDYMAILGEMKAGQEYDVEVLRGTEKLTFKIVPVARR